MNTKILAATDRALTPGNKKGANANPNSTAVSIQANHVLRGKSFDNKRFNMFVLWRQRLATGYTPCGRHNKIAAMSAMLENKANLGNKKPV